MYIQNTVKALRNKYDNFYYNGIEISKLNFEIDKFATICNKINELKHQLFQEPDVSKIRHNNTITSYIILDDMDDTRMICSISKKCMFGLYDGKKKEIIPLTKEIFEKFDYDVFLFFANETNKVAKRISRGLIKNATANDSTMLLAWESYQNEINKLENSFQHTYELEFVNGHKDFILTDEELSRACLESFQ